VPLGIGRVPPLPAAVRDAETAVFLVASEGDDQVDVRVDGLAVLDSTGSLNST